jgi:hypothetical protein
MKFQYLFKAEIWLDFFLSAGTKKKCQQSDQEKKNHGYKANHR